MQHRISEIDTESKTGTCTVCGPGMPVYSTWTRRATADRPATVRWRCATARRIEQRGRVRRKSAATVEMRALILATTHCPRCGTFIEDPGQLDMDHIEPKHQGGADEAGNIQLLCANCHRLKSKHERLGQPLPAYTGHR